MTATFILKKTDSDHESDKNSKNDITEKCYCTINTLHSLITSATRCKACHKLVCVVEDRKKAVGLACLLKIESLNQKDANDEKVDLSMQ